MTARPVGFGGAVALVLAILGLWLCPASSAVAATPTSSVTSDKLRVAVTDVFPNTPTITATPTPLQFTLTLTNSGTVPMTVTVSADRSDPIGSETELTSAISSPQPPSDQLVAPIRNKVRNVAVPAGQTVSVVFRTTTQTIDRKGRGICLCRTAIYPIWFTALGTDSAGTKYTATAQTYLPSFQSTPLKTAVSWVWPLLERPHRLAKDNVFLDDDLATAVSQTGRLTELLQTLTMVSPTVPMTVLTDPELIDELTTMTTGYRVFTSGGSTVAGTGGAAAKAWLTTLSTVLTDHPNVELAYTADADPAVDSLTRAGHNWTGPTAAELGTTALGRPASGALSWPVGQTLGAATLDELARRGTSTVLLSDRALTAATERPTTALAPVMTRTGEIAAAVTSTPYERLVSEILDPTGIGLELLPRLVAQLAIAPVVDSTLGPTVGRQVVLTPPRDLTVDPVVAARVIEATADSTWSRPLPLLKASTEIEKTDMGTLRGNVGSPQLPQDVVDSLDVVTRAIPSLEGMFATTSDPTLGQRLYASYPAAIQRCESTSLITTPNRARAMTRTLEQTIRRTLGAVSVVRPTEGYTLTSKSSLLPVTVVNRLNRAIQVHISITPQDSDSGFTAGSPDHTFAIPANSKVQEHIQATVDRVGSIKLIVAVTTPDGRQTLGVPVRLTAQSTVLGTIGVVITVVAGVVLVAALLLRYTRLLRRRRAEGSRRTRRPKASAGGAATSPTSQPTSGATSR